MGELSTEIIQDIHRAADLIRTIKNGVVLTGAGISTPSGIPDFRSAGSGLWTRYDPLEVASLSVFRYHPEKLFDWMRSLAISIRQALPNPAHIALAQLEQAGYVHTIITQNIDGLHQRAGSRCVLEVHGSFSTLTCISCYRQFDSTDFIEAYIERGEIPHCPDCAHILKPDVVLFEEQLPIRTWMQAKAACQSCGFLLVAGSSLEVVPAASLPIEGLEKGAKLVLINQTPTYLDVRADVIIPGDVAEIIPRIAAEVISAR
ncbi:MAG TPA: Sir2 family NAD-dependent protein deacetylase [Anaerolineales bacterium]|jgi:NAD-dependent deacetylase|nr:Sir2 family NAD-dependent protein deacetylase [Anaerolineales bacterium]